VITKSDARGEIQSMADAASAGGNLPAVLIGAIGFLTLVDLFAAQAILPLLTRTYAASAATAGLAVNAGTIGMAISSLFIVLVSNRVNRWLGTWLSLALLAVPTALLAWAPDIITFAALRVMQGLFMASAFALTASYLGEHLDPDAIARGLAAYVTGIVASNFLGRLVAAAAADQFGLEANFYLFAGLNIAGAVLVFCTFQRMDRMPRITPGRSMMRDWFVHLRRRDLRAAFGIGFLILFAFIGIFTYVNFVLVKPPLSVSQMSLGLVYLVFVPAMLTTPFMGRVAVRFGARATIWASLAVAGVGLPLLVASSLTGVVVGMILAGIGTFAAQAAATGYVGRAAMTDLAAANGLYLASYYLGGLVGAAALGFVFELGGWAECVTVVGAALALAALLARSIVEP
jgi:MFS transporter, YNFM family, putative membrane transport protein